jgi:DNA-binding PadR family transcriptional regulator
MRSSSLALTVLALLHYRPLHPYGMQRLIRQWGKDQVVNVGQRASLYRTINRLHAEGLIAVHETERDRAYPERTVYEITETGRRAAHEWLDEMLAEPKREFPSFPAALSHLLMLTPQEALEVLERRAERLRRHRAGLEWNLREQIGRGLPRISLIEVDYLRAVAATEEEWVTSVVEELRTGRLRWSPGDLAGLDGSAHDAPEPMDQRRTP